VVNLGIPADTGAEKNPAHLNWNRSRFNAHAPRRPGCGRGRGVEVHRQKIAGSVKPFVQMPGDFFFRQPLFHPFKKFASALAQICCDFLPGLAGGFARLRCVWIGAKKIRIFLVAQPTGLARERTSAASSRTA
jgi:hypothetical protein